MAPLAVAPPPSIVSSCSFPSSLFSAAAAAVINNEFRLTLSDERAPFIHGGALLCHIFFSFLLGYIKTWNLHLIMQIKKSTHALHLLLAAPPSSLPTVFDVVC